TLSSQWPYDNPCPYGSARICLVDSSSIVLRTFSAERTHSICSPEGPILGAGQCLDPCVLGCLPHQRNVRCLLGRTSRGDLVLEPVRRWNRGPANASGLEPPGARIHGARVARKDSACESRSSITATKSA